MTNRQAAIKIIKRLRRNGFQALLAGGCVRDMLLGRSAKDFDVATDAKPGDIIKLFRRTLKVGAKFGVVIVLLEDRQIEVATFRADVGYDDGRHPTKVKFVSATEDAARRDFTINGMFYDPLNDKVIDYVNGRADLKKRLIRTIGNPTERFAEDYLRMLRAVRFSTQLGFAIEPETFTAICKNVKNITKISGERKCVELEAILANPNRSTGLLLLLESGLAKAIFPGFVGEKAKFAIQALSELRKKVNFPLALAALFAGCKTEFALDKCKILKLSRNQTRHIKFLLAKRDKLLDEKMSLAKLRMILAEPYFWDLYELQKAIQKARDGRKAITPLIKLKRRIKALGDIELKPEPLLNGYDLMRLGAVPGPSLGQLAEEMYIAQLEGNLQTPKQAKQWAKNWLKKHKNIEK
ncbi:MAG: CCA tRNA nucleotidyltransferase [Planctomycetota bacterium]|jgi:poly(A) polymerase